MKKYIARRKLKPCVTIAIDKDSPIMMSKEKSLKDTEVQVIITSDSKPTAEIIKREFMPVLRKLHRQYELSYYLIKVKRRLAKSNDAD